MNRLVDPELAGLVDAVVAAIDVERSYELDRLREALEPFGGTILFDAELRLNGRTSSDELCICSELV